MGDGARLGTAFGTLAAFAVALRLLAKELAARHEEEDDRRRSQAHLVSAWTTQTVPLYDPESSAGRYELRIRNGSEEPTYRVIVMLVHRGSAFASDPVEADPHAEVIQLVHVRLPILPPQSADEKSVDGHVLAGAPLGLALTDSQGRRWKHYPDGRLVELARKRRRSRKDYMNAWITGELDRLDYQDGPGM